MFNLSNYQQIYLWVDTTNVISSQTHWSYVYYALTHQYCFHSIMDKYKWISIRDYIHSFHLVVITALMVGHGLRNWSRSGGSYGNNTLVICCPAPGRPSRPWSIPIITWLNNVVWNVFTTKYVQNHHQIEGRRHLASIGTSRISP